MAGKALLVLFAVVLLISAAMATQVSDPKHSHGAEPSKPKRIHGECTPMCRQYCKTFHSKRGCQRSCVPCCDTYNCVPGVYKTCSQWTEVPYRGKSIKCPKK